MSFTPPSDLKPEPLRRVKAKHIGGLVVVKGIVTRVTEVRPMMVVATYSCDTCGFENYQEIMSRNFTPLLECQSARCKAAGMPGKLFLQTRGSKFQPFQEIRLQEMVREEIWQDAGREEVGREGKGKLESVCSLRCVVIHDADA